MPRSECKKCAENNYGAYPCDDWEVNKKCDFKSRQTEKLVFEGQAYKTIAKVDMYCRDNISATAEIRITVEVLK